MILPPVHETFMNRCFELASKGLGNTSPNPLVGSVIVHDNRIIGEGYHQKCGEAHAEVNAIASAHDKNLLRESTLYVNLEPCAHFGKTPPCADLIVKHGIPRVVIANIDPNPKVQGKGIEKLKLAGIEVITGVLKEEGETLNRRFFLAQRKSRPYVILKWAQTLDGYIDILRNPTETDQPNWITNEYARMLVHKWRTEEDAIFVGTNTAFMDNPRLNVRDWYGKNPIRVVIDRTLRLPLHLNLFDGTVSTIVFTTKIPNDTTLPNVDYVEIPFDEYLPEHVLGELFRRGIQSILIEGGAKLLQSFINVGVWDEARVFVGNKYFINGTLAPQLSLKPANIDNHNGFSLFIYKNT